LHDGIPLATLEFSHASRKISGLSEVLKIDQEHLTVVVAEQKTAQAALDEATRAKEFSQVRRDVAANSVARAEQNVKNFEKLIANLSHPSSSENITGGRPVGIVGKNFVNRP
jgi:hypothetical protein